MLENLTPAARETLEFSQAEAIAAGEACVQPEHLLRALLRDSKGGASRVLRELSVDRESVAKLLARLAGAVLTPRDPGDGLGLGAGVLRVVELAVADAREDGHALACTDHLLLGLIRLDEPLTAEVLACAGLTLDAVRPLVASAGTVKRERRTENVSLRELEKKGFRKVKVLRAGDVNQLILKAVESVLAKHPGGLSDEERSRILAEAKAEHERQTKAVQELQEASARIEHEKQEAESRAEKIDEAHRNLEARLAEANARLVAERDKILAAWTELERERQALAAAPRGAGPLVCPRGHGGMDEVVREGVRLAVCPECLSTFFAPGQLDALVKKLGELSVEGLHRFLEPEEPG